ncbi:hypothetical protein ALC57_08452 [Trachymyrmex cornetzi]|uniref:Corticotropin-releasing factor domain-containing protein n=1 Tax=Trachymyrmex cornetzi TaxID=471704 RepID=A0A195E296_9HYME|nr:hypothetical protein ALC57_08452 [Trachymyrmex cornetzi]
MRYLSMTICVLVAFALPKSTCGHPATDNGRLVLNMLESRVSKLEAISEPKAISTFIPQKNLSIPTKSRQRRLSDQRLAELETLVSLSKLSQSLVTTSGHGQPDPRIM